MPKSESKFPRNYDLKRKFHESLGLNHRQGCEKCASEHPKSANQLSLTWAWGEVGVAKHEHLKPISHQRRWRRSSRTSSSRFHLKSPYFLFYFISDARKRCKGSNLMCFDLFCLLKSKSDFVLKAASAWAGVSFLRTLFVLVFSFKCPFISSVLHVSRSLNPSLRPPAGIPATSGVRGRGCFCFPSLGSLLDYDGISAGFHWEKAPPPTPASPYRRALLLLRPIRRLAELAVALSDVVRFQQVVSSG